MLRNKLLKMQNLLQSMESVLVAFSGGIDSSLVLKIAHDSLGERAIAATAVSPTFPDLELETARRVGQEIGVRHVIIDTEQLTMPDVVGNDANRGCHGRTDRYQALDNPPLKLNLG